MPPIIYQYTTPKSLDILDEIYVSPLYENKMKLLKWLITRLSNCLLWMNINQMDEWIASYKSISHDIQFPTIHGDFYSEST